MMFHHFQRFTITKSDELSTSPNSTDKNIEIVRQNALIRIRTPNLRLIYARFDAYLSFCPSKKEKSDMNL